LNLIHRLPKGQVKWITYLLEKYGLNYIAMAKDSKNHYQETWKQLRKKVKTFMNIPEQSDKWLREQGLENGFDQSDPKWQEPDTDDE
jgi:Ribosome biogenesis protein Nop16